MGKISDTQTKCIEALTEELRATTGQRDEAREQCAKRAQERDIAREELREASEGVAAVIEVLGQTQGVRDDLKAVVLGLRNFIQRAVPDSEDKRVILQDLAELAAIGKGE